MREVVVAVLLSVPEAGLTLLSFYKNPGPLAYEVDLSNFVANQPYYTFLIECELHSSVFLWALGKRIWHIMDLRHVDEENELCASVRNSFGDLYETIKARSSLDCNVGLQVVLFGLLDGPLEWLEGERKACNQCFRALIRFCLARCSSLDLPGPYGYLLDSTCTHILETYDLDICQARLAFFDMIVNRAIGISQAVVDSRVQFRYYSETYLSVLQDVFNANYAFAVIQPYFQKLYKEAGLLLIDHGTMPTIQAVHSHCIFALRQARRELLHGKCYTAGVWCDKLSVESFDTVVRSWSQSAILTAEEADDLCIHKDLNSHGDIYNTDSGGASQGRTGERRPDELLPDQELSDEERSDEELSDQELPDEERSDDHSSNPDDAMEIDG